MTTQTQQTLDPDITYNFTGCRGTDPCIKSGAGVEVSPYYLFRNYETAVKRGNQLLQISTQLQQQRDDALRSLDGADSIIEEQAARIEELEEALARIEAARIAQLEDFEATQFDASIYGQ